VITAGKLRPTKIVPGVAVTNRGIIGSTAAILNKSGKILIPGRKKTRLNGVGISEKKPAVWDVKESPPPR
jgi:hypothetical protein